MTVFAEISVPILLMYCWSLNFGYFRFASGDKPHCTGDPLSPDKFSGEEDVGLIRDIAVDVVARNLHNKLSLSAAPLCEDLANERTSTCIFKCMKWKRSSCWGKGGILCTSNQTEDSLINLYKQFCEANNGVSHKVNDYFVLGVENESGVCPFDPLYHHPQDKILCSFAWKATSRIMTMAEALMDHFKEVSKNSRLNNINDEQFIFECINVASDRLIKSGAASEDSKIIVQLSILRTYFCIHYELDYNQKAYLESIDHHDDETMKTIGSLLENKDLVNAILQFFRSFHTDNEARITKYYLENNVVKAHDSSLSGIIRLIFLHKAGKKPAERGAVILKVPSLAPLPYAELKKTNMYDREAYFYLELLPALYKLLDCRPFAPILYEKTEENALVLEDLSVQGYKPGNKLQQLDNAQIREALDVLARYHASGHKYLQSLPKDDPNIPLIRSFQPTLLSRSQKFVFEKFFQIVGSSLSESLHQKLRDREKEILADPMTVPLPNENSMTVIIHGDFRANNILFEYMSISMEVSRAKFIDWKMSREASPVIDLIYFFITSVPPQLYEADIDNYLTFYQSLLKGKLSDLKISRSYELFELKADIRYYKSFYLRTLCITWQQIMRAGSPGPETESYKSSAIKWLKYFEKIGFFNE